MKLLSPDPKGEFLFEVSEYVIQALHRITRARDAQLDAAMAPMGLNVTRYRTLIAVVRAVNCTMSDLAALIGYDRTTLARAVETLVADGLIRRSTVQADRRYVELSATPEGEALYRRTIPEAERLNDRLFEGIPDDQLRAVMRGLETMLGNLGAGPADIAKSLGPRWT
ncbi:MAG TPA: MarR family winged helix-turn-helix transcriptional regulator [Caulobacteraceae bacterium]